MSNGHGTVQRNPIPAPSHPESHVVIRDIVYNGLRKLMASTTALAFLSSSVHAQEGSVPEEDKPVPICGTFETVEVDGRIINQRTTENCEDEVVENTGSSGGFGIVAGGLLVAGLAAAGGGGGGNEEAPPSPNGMNPPVNPPNPPVNPPVNLPDPLVNPPVNPPDPPVNPPVNPPDPPVNPPVNPPNPPVNPPVNPPDPPVNPPVNPPDPPVNPPVNPPDPSVNPPVNPPDPPVNPPVNPPDPPVNPPVNPPDPSVNPPVNPPDPPVNPPVNPDPEVPKVSIPDNPENPVSWRTSEFNFQPTLGLIGAEYRYAKGATGEGTLGAIYDSGIALDHEDVGRIKLNLSHAYSIDNSNDLSDIGGHGTSVYGVAGASRNEIGIHGIAPGADFMILKQGITNNLSNNFADALKRSIDAGADAMNNSWTSSLVIGQLPIPAALRTFLGSDILTQLNRSAEAGVSVVFATGNDTRSEPTYLASIPTLLPELADNWIAVTGLGPIRELASAELLVIANHCGTAMNWCLAAPGWSIKTLDADGGTRSPSGTSFAAPHVTGAILLLKDQFDELTTPEIHKILFDTAVDLGAPGVDSVFGHGALNLGEAMTPQGTMMVELGSRVDERTAPLSASWITESAITGGTLVAALSDQSVLVTDRYDRGYLASLGPRVVAGSFDESLDMRASLAVAFSRVNDPYADLSEAGFDLRFDAFGPDYDVTRIAHGDPVMGLISQTEGTGFSMRVPTGKATLSMASATTADGNAISLSAGLPFGEDHSITVSLGHARETNSLLGAKTHGAFAGLNSETIYGRVQTDVALGKRVTLNGSVTAGRTSFESTGLISTGRADTLGAAMGLTFNSALMPDDRLALSLVQPFAVSGGQMTLRGGTGISAAEAGQRTNRISLGETNVPLGAADRVPELHLGYMHKFDAIGWADANLAFGGIARLDGGAQMAAARVALTFKF